MPDAPLTDMTFPERPIEDELDEGCLTCGYPDCYCDDEPYDEWRDRRLEHER